MSLRTRITVSAVAAVAVCGTVAGALLLHTVAGDERDRVDRDLTARAKQILAGSDPLAPPRPVPVPAGPGDPLLAGSGAGAQIAIGDRVVARRGDLPAAAPPPPLQDGLRTIEIDGERWRSLTVLAKADVRFQLLSSLAPVDARVAHDRHLILSLGGLALALTAVAAWLFSTLAIRPLARLQAGAGQVSGAADTPLPVEGPAEVRALATALNEMLARLQRAILATRRFASDAGHELRTPLTSLRANVDALRRNPDLPQAERAALLADLAGEQERMTRLLEGLQALARGDAATGLAREEVDLADLLDSAVHAARGRHPAVPIELGRVDELRLHGWEGGLRLIADNLIDNAALHGGAVKVSLQDGVLSFDDDGPGIPADRRAALLEPFARGTTSAPGTGLGLAIVAQQAALHGAALHLLDSPLGGLRVELRLASAM